MKSFRKILFLAPAMFAPAKVFACAACYGGNVDSAMTEGMNWGIFTLLGVIVTVLATIAGFFVYIIRKETAAANDSAPKTPIEV